MNTIDTKNGYFGTSSNIAIVTTVKNQNCFALFKYWNTP